MKDVVMNSTQEIERLVSAERSRFSHEQRQLHKYSKWLNQFLVYVVFPGFIALCIAGWLFSDVLKDLK